MTSDFLLVTFMFMYLADFLSKAAYSTVRVIFYQLMHHSLGKHYSLPTDLEGNLHYFYSILNKNNLKMKIRPK